MIRKGIKRNNTMGDDLMDDDQTPATPTPDVGAEADAPESDDAM